MIWCMMFFSKLSISIKSGGRIPECGLLQNCLEELAPRYPATKFVKIISTDCIPNYPDRNVPTILVYNNSAVKGTYVGLQKFGGKRCTPECKLLHSKINIQYPVFPLVDWFQLLQFWVLLIALFVYAYNFVNVICLFCATISFLLDTVRRCLSKIAACWSAVIQ